MNVWNLCPTYNSPKSFQQYGGITNMNKYVSIQFNKVSTCFNGVRVQKTSNTDPVMVAWRHDAISQLLLYFFFSPPLRYKAGMLVHTEQSSELWIKSNDARCVECFSRHGGWT